MVRNILWLLISVFLFSCNSKKEAGKFADFIILDQDLIKADAA